MGKTADLYGKTLALLREHHKFLFSLTGLLLFASSCITMLLFIMDIGFGNEWLSNPIIAQIDTYYLAFYFFGALFRLGLDWVAKVRRLAGLEYILFGVLLVNIILLTFTDTALLDRTMVIAIFAVEISKYSFNLDKLNLSPTIIFISSFAIVIFTGTVLLMLPNATTKEISFVDAAFTATSAVTITGLAVLDMQKDFTIFGQTIVLILIQIGGLGMMTFTSFLGLFFKGESSFQNTLLVKDYVGAENSNEAFKFVIKVVVFTLGVELIGFFFIYFFSNTGFLRAEEQFFFSLFHTVSAFCNAGFSTLSNGLSDINLRYNYGFQWVITLLAITGAMGFPIIFNVYAYAKHFIQKKIRLWFYKEKFINKAWVINLNTAIVFYTTTFLLIAGAILFYIFEQNGVIAEHRGFFGKLTTTFFCSANPRSNGFSTINMEQLTLPSILIIMLLMWIGGSPASTGGGIKITSFAVAFLNIFSLIRGKNRIDVAHRTIPEASINKAFAIIMLSFIGVGLVIFALAIFEPQQNFLHLAFEAFSAYFTVGLSLNLTPTLCDNSKIVLMIAMFLGRVGTLNLLISLMRQVVILPYSYPKERIMTN